MKLIFTLFLFCAATTFSFTGEQDENASRGTVRAQLCDFWKNDFSTNTYTCSFLKFPVNLVTATRHEEEVARLEGKVADLEERLAKLEAKR